MIASFREQWGVSSYSCPSASWPSACSILVSSWREDLCHGSDSALTAEMLLQLQGLFNWWVLHNKRRCSFSLSCMWTATLIIYLWPTVCKFPIIATFIVAILQTPDVKGILLMANNEQMQCTCMECNKWIYCNCRLGSLLHNAKQKPLFLFLVMWTFRFTN